MKFRDYTQTGQAQTLTGQTLTLQITFNFKIFGSKIFIFWHNSFYIINFFSSNNTSPSTLPSTPNNTNNILLTPISSKSISSSLELSPITPSPPKRKLFGKEKSNVWSYFEHTESDETNCLIEKCPIHI